MRSEKQYARKALCLGLFTLGLSAFAVKTYIDVDFWRSQAATPQGQWEFGAAAAVFCAATLLLTCVVATRLRERISFWNVCGSGIAVLGLFYVTIYGMSSIVGFGMRERISPYQAAQAQLEAERLATDRTNELRKTYTDKQLAYLQDQGRKAPGPQSRQAAYTAANEAFGSIEVKADPVAQRSADPQAEGLHELFPAYSVTQIQYAWAAAFGVGLLIVELLGMGFAVGMWPKPVEAKEAVPAKEEVKEATPFDGIPHLDFPPLPAKANVIHPPQFQRPTGQALAVEPHQPSLLELDVERHLSAVEGVREFWPAKTRPRKGARIGATAMYKAYLQWCEENDIEKVSQQKFGRISGTICERDTKGMYWAYLDRAILGEDDESESLVAA